MAWLAALATAAWAIAIASIIVLAAVGEQVLRTPAPQAVLAAPPPDGRNRPSDGPPAAFPEGDLPAGEGRDLVSGICGACHSLKLVTQQGLSREAWTEVLAYMVEEQEMQELEAEDERLVLDYLERYYGPDRRLR